MVSNVSFLSQTVSQKMKKTNELIYLSVIFYFVFPQYSPNPLNFTRLTFATTLISCLTSFSCSHEHCLCSSKPPLSVWLSHSIQEDHTTASDEAMVPEFVPSRLTALSLPQGTCLLMIIYASISTPAPLHPISVPFHPQLEIPT